MAQTIPVITDIPGLVQWRNAVTPALAGIQTPKIPWNFTVSNKQGGNYLTWQPVKGADGYIVDISTTGDFTVGAAGVTSETLKGNANVAYFDSVPTSGGTAPGKRYYRVKATSGTTTKPQVMVGNPTAVLSSTAIAPNDTTTVSTTSRDTTTTDQKQVNGRNKFNLL